MSIAAGVGLIFASSRPASMRGVGFRWRSTRDFRAAPRALTCRSESRVPPTNHLRCRSRRFVIRAREVTPRHTPGGLAQKSDGDCEAIGAREFPPTTSVS